MVSKYILLVCKSSPCLLGTFGRLCPSSLYIVLLCLVGHVVNIAVDIGINITFFIFLFFLKVYLVSACNLILLVSGILCVMLCSYLIIYPFLGGLNKFLYCQGESDNIFVLATSAGTFSSLQCYLYTDAFSVNGLLIL